MLKNQPSILRMPEDRKQETVAAVEQAIGIILNQYERCELVEDPNVSLHVRMRSFSDRLKVFGNYVQFIVGRSQQPHIKCNVREWDVRLESRKIAAETGVPFDQVYEFFMSLMREYIRPR